MPIDVIVIFLKYSSEFQNKTVKKKNHGLEINPIKSQHFMQRWQIDLMDFRTLPDGEFKWICNVQDHFTKY